MVCLREVYLAPLQPPFLQPCFHFQIVGGPRKPHPRLLVSGNASFAVVSFCFSSLKVHLRSDAIDTADSELMMMMMAEEEAYATAWVALPRQLLVQVEMLVLV